MAIATIPYDITMDRDGRKYEVHIPALTVPKCSNCGAISIDQCAEDQIESALQQRIDLAALTQIRKTG